MSAACGINNTTKNLVPVEEIMDVSLKCRLMVNLKHIILAFETLFFSIILFSVLYFVKIQ